MKKILSNVKLIPVVFVNTIKYNLWKATFRKIFAQVKSESVSDDAMTWYKNTAINMSLYASLNNLSINEDVISDQIKDIIEERKNDSSDVNTNEIKRSRMGGFANVPFLYSIVKDLNKKSCLECGVSMGASSYAILKALADKDEGLLISNDLPYLWIPNSIQKIGTLVSENLKPRWKLFIGDDKDNLPIILKDIKEIDFAHYDSNKSYEAREFFCNSIMSYLSNNATIIFDDIVDNDHFFNFTKTLDSSWKSFVLDDGNKYIGLIQKS